MRAGELRQRVTVRQYTEADDGHLGMTTTALPIRNRISAQVEPLQGRDLERARAIDPRAAFRVRLRYWQDYRTDLAGGRFYLQWHDGRVGRELEAIEPPVEVESRVAITFACRERA